MAIIECPGCGEKISDKSKKCVHCGYTLVQEPPRICPECGAEVSDGEAICPKCGYPMTEDNPDSSAAAPQQVEVTGVKVDQKSKKMIVIAAAALIVIILGVFGIQQFQKQQAIKQAEQAAREYKSNLSSACTIMLSGAAEAETCGNLIKKVWYNAIHEDWDSETDKYTRPSYSFVDFNTALANLFADPDFSSKITSIKDNQTIVQGSMKELKNPPEEYEDAYAAISDFYDAYLKLTNLAVNPQGSLQTYSEDFNEADSETVNKYNAMKLYLD